MFALAIISATLSACGGAGGGTPPVTTSPAPGSSASASTSPSPSPSPAPTSASVSGTLTDYVTNAPIANAVVTIGGTPPPTCTGWSGCGSPASPTVTATTSASGAFNFAKVANGTYFLTIASAADATLNPASGTQAYTILHRFLTVSGTTVALGTVNISKLTSDESAWVAQENSDRATVAYPATGGIVADEYAEEQARKWPGDVVDGTTQYSDSAYGPYQTAYSNSSGAIGSVGGALDLSSTWSQAMTDWYAEKANCPNGDWRTCTFADNTGHYINLAQDSLVWVGVGESTSAFTSGTYSGMYAFDVMTVYNGQTARTAPDARKHRALTFKGQP